MAKRCGKCVSTTRGVQFRCQSPLGHEGRCVFEGIAVGGQQYELKWSAPEPTKPEGEGDG